MQYPFDTLELLVTLRCNAACRNCIRLCNMESVTGLNQNGLDMTAEQVDAFIRHVRVVHSAIGGPVTPLVVITGGEPLLHPRVAEFAHRIYDGLVKDGCVGRLEINSNLSPQVRELAKSLEPWVANYTSLAEKSSAHSAVLLHPDDTPGGRPSYVSCTHYRKRRVEVSAFGYSLCCAAGGYIRMMGLSHLFCDWLPNSISDFPFIGRMDDVCQHCAFGKPGRPESEVGCPVSDVWKMEAAANRAEGGMRIRREFR